MSPDTFWALSYREFANILIANNPELKFIDEPFFNEEELELLEQMKNW